MEHFTILQELWESDTVIFALIGCAVAVWIGILRKQPGKRLTGAIISAALYAVCEILSGLHTGYLPAILLLFCGNDGLGKLHRLLARPVHGKSRKEVNFARLCCLIQS